MDEANRVAAVWVKKKTARGPSVFDPRKHIFDPQHTAEFLGAPRKDIVNWLDNVKRSGWLFDLISPKSNETACPQTNSLKLA